MSVRDVWGGEEGAVQWEWGSYAVVEEEEWEE